MDYESIDRSPVQLGLACGVILGFSLRKKALFFFRDYIWYLILGLLDLVFLALVLLEA